MRGSADIVVCVLIGIACGALMASAIATDMKPKGDDMTEYPREWEEVSDQTLRLKVPEGWVVQVEQYVIEYDKHDNKIPKFLTTAVCFVPDPEHKWKLEDSKPQN